uniref:Uncharacterized protein n=1 Tax=Cacopsylla melanoneura TaxID=428564 RepID=A0A8D8Z703_9HEMI
MICFCFLQFRDSMRLCVVDCCSLLKFSDLLHSGFNNRFPFVDFRGSLHFCLISVFLGGNFWTCCVRVTLGCFVLCVAYVLVTLTCQFAFFSINFFIGFYGT